MNGNNTTNTIEKTGWGIIKWTIISVVTLGFLGTIFWVLLYSNFTANFAYVIPIRNRYNKVFPQNLTFQIQGTKAGSYIYAFTGKLIAVDLNNRTISLSGSDSKVYIFKLSDGLIDTDDPSLFKIVANPKPTTNIQIVWFDQRSLNQILSDYSKNPTTTINANQGTFYSITALN